MWNDRRRWAAAVAAAALGALAVGVPTDVLDTPFFTRMTPVRWWEIPVLALTVALTGLWVAIPRPTGDVRGRGSIVGSVTAAVLAVGCPVCNKVVVGLLGISGALGIWAPAQPALATLSVAALAAAAVVRWRRRRCGPEACASDVTGETTPVARIAPVSGPAAGDQLAEQRDQAFRDLIALDARADTDEIPPETAARLRAEYERAATEAMKGLLQAGDAGVRATIPPTHLY